MSKISFKEFGQYFLGPSLLGYIRKVKEEGRKTVFPLAREGYVFDKIFDSFVDLPSSRYLKVSRALLFRITIDDERCLEYSLKPKFSGSFEDLLIHRFGFSKKNLVTVLSEIDLIKTFSLPRDYDDVVSLIGHYGSALAESVSESKAAYLEYLESIEFKDNPLVLDLGYNGTIQKLLTLLTSQNTSGLYFIASDPGVKAVYKSNAKMSGVFAEDVQMGDGCLMLDRSMFLESLLTAPEGQLKDIRKNPITGEFEFFYGKRANTQKHFHELEQVFEGAIEHVKHCFKHDISYSKEEIHHLFNQFVTKRSVFPAITWKLFEIDDAVSGNGNVDPLAFFGL